MAGPDPLPQGFSIYESDPLPPGFEVLGEPNADWTTDPLKRNKPAPLVDAVSGGPQPEQPTLEGPIESAPAPSPEDVARGARRRQMAGQREQAKADALKADEAAQLEQIPGVVQPFTRLGLGLEHGWDSTLAMMRGNRADFAIAMHGPTPELEAAAKKAKEESDYFTQSSPDGTIAQVGANIGNLAASMFSTGKQAVKAAGAGAVVGGAGGSALGPGGTFVGAVSGGAAGLTVGFISDSYVTNTGQIMGDLKDAGLEDDNAKAWGMLGGSVMAALDLTGIGLVARPFTRVVERKAVQNLVVDELKQQLAKSPVKEALKDYLFAAGGETVTETMQQVVQDVSTDLAKQGSGGDYKTLFNDPERRKQVVQNAVQTAVMTAEGMLALGVPGAVVGGVRTARAQGHAEDALFGAPEAGPSVAEAMSPDMQRQSAAMARGAPMVTPEDHASPLPTDLIQQGKGQAEIDLAHPGETVLPEGGTVQEFVDNAMGAAEPLRTEDGRRFVLTTTDANGVQWLQGSDAGIKKFATQKEAALWATANSRAGDFEIASHPDGGFGLTIRPDLASPEEKERLREENRARIRAEREGNGSSARDALKAKIRGAESSGNDSADNPNSSASGRYQFTDKTWAALGGDPAKKNDPAEQERLMDKLTSQNEAALAKAGNQTAGNLYLAHFLGAGGAIHALADPNAKVDAKVQAANSFTEGWTNAQLAAWANRKMGGKVGEWTNNPNLAADRHWAEQDKGADGEELTFTEQAVPAEEPAKPAQEGGFDSEAFNRTRDETIAASKAAGNQHLDDLEPAVETMRGKPIYYAHDPKITGTVRTVANTGEVVVHWNDRYSAEKEMATERTYGQKMVHESWLQPTDLKDYVVGEPSSARTAAQPTPQLSKQDQLKQTLAENRYVPFEANTGTLNIPRAEMPQIKAEHRGAMVNFLNARGIQHQEETVAADSLKPSQGEYSPAKVEKALGFEGGLFDTHDTTGDLFAKPTDPVTKAKAALQSAMDALDGKPEAKVEAAPPAEKPPEERGLKPLFDEDNPDKQIGFFHPETGKVELKDAGEKIGGARKDMWALRGLALTDLESMTRGEAHQFVTKDNVWPKPDYAKLVEDGAEPEAAAAVKLLRDSLAAKPKVDSDEGRRDFIETMQAARKVLDATKTAADVRTVQTRLYDALGVSHGSYSYDREQQAEPRRKLFSIFKGRSASFSIDYKMRRKVEAMVAAGWPAQAIEPWTRRFTVRVGRGADGEKWFVTNKDRRIVADGLASKEAAEAKAKELYEGLTKNEDGTKKAPERPHLDKLERTGKDIRGERDVSPDDFLSDFGFRGVEFGNWVANDERQKAVNLAYEGLHDLADTLGIPPETLSLGGQLGLAFGARGSGKAAAHYEPGKLVINLTKLSGAGTLAHEWGHALDHYFGQLDSDQGTRGAPDYASGGRSPYNFKALGNLRPELASAFDQVMDALFKREKPRAEVVRDLELAIEKVQAGITRQEERIKEYETRDATKGDPTYAKAFAKQSQEWIGFQQTRLKALGDRLAEARDEAKPLAPQKVESSYYQNAQALSGKSGAKGYWARPTELFARAFEAYAFDKIKERGNKSQYLVQGVEENRFPAALYGGNPYPTGAERAKINAAFDHLFETVDVRGIPAPREGGPTQALASALENPSQPFYSALEKGIEANPTKRASAEQWKATLARTPGVKQEELEWSGLTDWLDMQQGPVDREALLGVVRDHGISVDEIVMGGPIPEEKVIASPTLRAIMRDIREEWVDRGMRYDRDRGHIPEPYVDDVRGYFDATQEELAADKPFVVKARTQVQQDDGTFTGAFTWREVGRFDTNAEAQRVRLSEWQRLQDEHRAQLEQTFNALPYEQQVAGTQLEAPRNQFQSWSSDPSNPTYRELLITLPLGERGNPERAPATHWDQEAVVAHARFMDKTDADGKRVLFIEEVQSDWHQKGRDQGYERKYSQAEIDEAAAKEKDALQAALAARRVMWEEAARVRQEIFGDDPVALRATIDPTNPDHPVTMRDDVSRTLLSRPGAVEDREKIDEIVHAVDRAILRERELHQDTINKSVGHSGTPNAPFKSSWPALVMKRMIRWAVDHGYDKVAWTTGEEQASRYSLEKHIGRVTFTDNTSGGIGKADLDGPTTHGTLTAYTPEGRQIYSEHVDVERNPNAIADVVGREVADKLLAAEPEHYRSAGLGLRKRELSGLDLKTGGEGMRGFYDRNLVNITNDIIKKYGAKVGRATVFQGKASLQSFQQIDQWVKEAEDRLEQAKKLGDPADEINRWQDAVDERRMVRDGAKKRAEQGTHPGFEITDKLREAASSGFALFARGAGRVNLSPEQRAAFAEALPAQLKALGIDDKIGLRLTDSAGLAHTNTQGQYWNRVISVALDVARDPAHVVDHESIHAMKAMGLFTPTEWKILTDGAWADPEIRAWALRNYAGKDTAYLKEEAAAEWIAQQGSILRELEARAKKSFVARMALRALQFVMAVGRTIRSMRGARRAGDIAHLFRTGQIGEREVGEGEAPRDSGPRTFGKNGAKASRTDQIETPAFKRWFGNSKVVNKDGSPKVVYHGTDADFSEFARSEDIGFHFGTKDQSHGRTVLRSRIRGIIGQPADEGDNIMPAYLKIEKPLRLKDLHDWNPTAVISELQRHGLLSDREATRAYDGEIIDREWVREKLAAKGYDGIVYDNATEGRGDSYIAFSPEQVKSAVGNNGEFDPLNPDIRRSIADEVFWHGSPSGSLQGGASGLHLGTKEAARQALEARIGIPADGSDWDGSRQYGDTLLAGKATQRRLAEQGRNVGTGQNADAPEEDYYPTDKAKYGDGSLVPPHARPTLRAFRVVGPMSNSRSAPHEDFKANGYMKGQLARGAAKRGYYYENVGEDAGSVSIVVPSAAHLEEVPLDIRRSTAPTIVDSKPERLAAPVRAILDAFDGNRSDKIGEALDAFRTVVQDRMLPVMRTQAAVERLLGRKLTDEENPYLAEELFHGRTGARLEVLTDQHIEPLFEAMRQAKISPDELQTYLYARHAKERNARIAAINPEFAEGTGSGMTDEEAAAILSAVDASGKKDALDQLATRVDQMLAFSLATRVESGLLSAAEAKGWQATYQHYVPLRGRPGDELNGEDVARVNRQSGMSVRGKESRRAFGRKSKAQDILAYSILQAEEAVVRSEQNEVAKALLELAQAAPDPTFWRVDKISRVPVFNKASGQVTYRSESRIAAEDAPYTVSAKVDGVEHRITMNRDDPMAAHTAAAMRNLNIQQFKFVVATLGRVNRFLSAINTTYSPEFVISNAFRDLQTAGINLAGVDVKGLERKVLKDYPAALVAATKGAFGKGSGEWGKWYREFKLEGGQTAFNDVGDLAKLRAKVAHSAKLKGRFGAKQLLVAVVEGINHVNNGVENALRLATYKNAVQAGVSKKQAASLAKNVTVNFNRKGTAGPLINSLYLFFNASMQGTARILQAMHKSRKVQGILVGAVVAGFALQLLNSSWSDDDDDGEKFYNKISDYEKQRNLIVMLHGGTHIKIPLPWGYNVFPNFGRMLARLWQGEKPMRAMADWGSGVIDAFNPVGGAQSILSVISPTITDPIVDLSTNRDYAGKPIMPDEKEHGAQVPDTQRYWNSVPAYDKWVTDQLGHLTGGDDVRPGGIDISPETLDYLQQTVLGAAGNFVRNVTALGAKALSNDPSQEFDKNDLPFYRKVVGEKPGWYDKAAFYGRLAEVEQDVDYGKKYIKAGDVQGLRSLFADEADVISLETAAKAARKEMRGVNKLKVELDNAVAKGEFNEGDANKLRGAIQARQDQAIEQFNSIYLKTVAKPLRP